MPDVGFHDSTIRTSLIGLVDAKGKRMGAVRLGPFIEYVNVWLDGDRRFHRAHDAVVLYSNPRRYGDRGGPSVRVRGCSGYRRKALTLLGSAIEATGGTVLRT